MRPAALFLCGALIAAETPARFDAVDVRWISKDMLRRGMRIVPVHGGRFEIKGATLLDLIKQAYGVDDDHLTGGPSWLELNRYDLAARQPEGTTADQQKLMLQTMLQERFGLVVRNETRPMPGFALTAAKKPQLKEAAGTEESGCKPESGNASAPGAMTIRMGANVAGSMGLPSTVSLGPGGLLEFHCRNITMPAFLEAIRTLPGGRSFAGKPMVDETGLKGSWNFDAHWTALTIGGMEGNQVTLAEALDKQLGLKLEPRPLPAGVLVIDTVNERPSPNPPGTGQILPVIPLPTIFEVASVKAVDPSQRVMSALRVQPGGSVSGTGVPMSVLLRRAFNINNDEEIAGIPSWAVTSRYVLNAKAPATDPSAPPLDNESLAPMLQALLKERFQLEWHSEERSVSAYALVAAKPKLKQADPSARTSCTQSAAPGMPVGAQLLSCRNLTLQQFGEALWQQTPELSQPVADATGVEGSWDFSVSFSPVTGLGGFRPAAAEGAASDPTGSVTIFEALERQLGLKLEKQKRLMKVIVIDHLEQTPSGN